MDVLFLSPHYPGEMHHFTRGLAEVGARVHGVGDQPVEALPPMVRAHLTSYLHVPRIMDEDDVLARVLRWVHERGLRLDRVEALWEPLVLLAARLRERLGVEGISHDVALGFRDKGVMKQRIAAAGLRVPRSRRAASEAEILAVAPEVGFPLVVKPIAGAGSADTFRADDLGFLKSKLNTMSVRGEWSVEEYIDGDEFTFDALCIEGRVVYQNVVHYLPRPIISRHEEWISPAQVTIRDLDQPMLSGGLQLGAQVVRALGYGTGFIHMEWFRNSKGEAVFGEIGARSGGGHLVDQMNFTSDIDLFREWARVVCWKSFEADVPRAYNCAAIFKRAHGQGRIQRIDGLDAFRRANQRWICWENFVAVGAPRRDWKNSLIGDGFIIVRHPEWGGVWRLMEQCIGNIHLIAG